MLNKIRKLFQILRTYDNDLSNLNLKVLRLEAELKRAEDLIKIRTKIAVDVNFQTANHIITIGRYNNIDYIQSYAVNDRSFHRLVDTVKSMEKFGDAAIVDAPPNFRAALLREVKL